MRILAGIACAATMALLAVRWSAPAPVSDDGIRVVDARAPWPVVPVVTATPAVAPVMPPAAIPDVKEEEVDPRRPDTEVIAELFASQQRDMAWAPDAEAILRSRTPQAGAITCAEFMCRIEMRPTGPADPASAERYADTASRDWPAGLTYNPDTATIGGYPDAPTVIFYATRAAGDAGSS